MVDLSSRDPRVAELLKGSVDLHCHSGPSVMPRLLNHAEMMRQAAAVGMRAVCFKDHYYPTAPIVMLLNEEYPDSPVKLIGSVVLNNAAGGFNPYALDISLKMGARVVWMPTASAANHLRQGHRKQRLRTNMPLLPPTGLEVVDRRGRVLDEVKECLDIIAQHDAVMSAGHLHISELWPLFTEAKSRGVKRLLVNHPNYVLEASLDDIKELASMGVMLEHSINMFVETRTRKYDGAFLKQLIDAAGVDNSMLGSDLGQRNNVTPIEGFVLVIELCLGLGYSPDEVRKLVGSNAAKLAGLDG